MPAPQSTHENAVLAPAPTWFAFAASFGSFVWTLKMIFELGNRMPRINWAKLPAGGNTGPPAADLGVGDAGVPGRMMVLSASSFVLRSARAEGNPPACRM